MFHAKQNNAPALDINTLWITKSGYCLSDLQWAKPNQVEGYLPVKPKSYPSTSRQAGSGNNFLAI